MKENKAYPDDAIFGAHGWLLICPNYAMQGLIWLTRHIHCISTIIKFHKFCEYPLSIFIIDLKIMLNCKTNINNKYETNTCNNNGK